MQSWNTFHKLDAEGWINRLDLWIPVSVSQHFLKFESKILICNEVGLFRYLTKCRYVFFTKALLEL
jgi:hypothetical protein